MMFDPFQRKHSGETQPDFLLKLTQRRNEKHNKWA